MAAHALAGELDVGGERRQDRAGVILVLAVGELAVSDVEVGVLDPHGVGAGTLVVAAHDVHRGRRILRANDVHAAGFLVARIGLREVERALAQVTLARKVHRRASGILGDVQAVIGSADGAIRDGEGRREIEGDGACRGAGARKRVAAQVNGEVDGEGDLDALRGVLQQSNGAAGALDVALIDCILEARVVDALVAGNGLRVDRLERDVPGYGLVEVEGVAVGSGPVVERKAFLNRVIGDVGAVADLHLLALYRRAAIGVKGNRGLELLDVARIGTVLVDELVLLSRRIEVDGREGFALAELPASVGGSFPAADHPAVGRLVDVPAARQLCLSGEVGEGAAGELDGVASFLRVALDDPAATVEHEVAAINGNGAGRDKHNGLVGIAGVVRGVGAILDEQVALGGIKANVVVGGGIDAAQGNRCKRIIHT